jgi:hypothetical protein
MEDGPNTTCHHLGSAAVPEEDRGTMRVRLRRGLDGYNGRDLNPAGTQESQPPVDGPDRARRLQATRLAIIPGNVDKQR